MALSSTIVHERLRQSARTFRRSRGARFLLAGAALSLLLLFVFLTLDAWLHFGPAGRWPAFVTTLSAFALGAALALRSWRPAVSDASMARRIEQASGGVGNVLISAVQFDRALPGDSPLRTALFNEMADPFPKIKWDKVFDVRLLKKLGIALGAACVVLFGWALFKPNYFANSVARIFMPASRIAPLTRTKIDTIIPGDVTIVHGRELHLTATLAGEVPKTAWVWFREEGSSWQKVLLDREAGHALFDFTWKEVKRPLDYYIEAGDAVSETHRVTVRPKTAINSRTAEIAPPAYTGLATEKIADFSVLQNIVPGSTVALGFEFNNEVAELKTTDDKGEAIAAARADATHWKIAPKILTNRTLRLEFRDEVGTTDTAVLQVAIRPDEPPKITVSEPAEGRELVATKTSTLALKFSAMDAFGLASVAIFQSTNDRDDAKLVQEFATAKGRKNFEGAAQIPLAPFIGDEERVTFRIVAKDANDGTGPAVTVSRPIVVSIKAQDKLEKQISETAAKLQRGLEALIKLQSANLDASRAAESQKNAAPLTPLVERQVAIADSARTLATAADLIAPEVRTELRAMLNREFSGAVVTLRNAD